MNRPATFDQAEKLLNTRPLPVDILRQLDRLEEETPEDQVDTFQHYFEAAYMAIKDYDPEAGN